MILVIIQCRKCGQLRRAVKDTPREIEKICGNCWDWEKFPNLKTGIEYVDKATYSPKYSK
jgi:hypothetical protein